MDTLFGVSTRYRKACKRPKTRSRTTGRCKLPSLKNINRSKAKVTYRKKRVTSGDINVKAAKQMLGSKVMSMSGLKTAPSWVSSFKGVSGPTIAEKAGRVNRTLLACKQMGIPLVQKNGKKYKAFSTLKAQCGVRFTRENKNKVVSTTNVESKLLSKLRKMRESKAASGVVSTEPTREQLNNLAEMVAFGRASRFGFRPTRRY